MVLKEKLQQTDAFKTGADAAEAGVRTGAESTGAMRSVLQSISTVNPDKVSKVVDGNGEPVLVYHDTAPVGGKGCVMSVEVKAEPKPLLTPRRILKVDWWIRPLLSPAAP